VSLVVLSALEQLLTGELPPLPDQAQLGLQQSQNRVAYPSLPVVGGWHVVPLLELDELPAAELCELDAAVVVEELLAPVVVEELLVPVVVEELLVVVVEPPVFVVLDDVLMVVALLPPIDVVVEVEVEVEVRPPAPPLPFPECWPASQPYAPSPANATAADNTRRSGLVIIRTPPIRRAESTVISRCGRPEIEQRVLFVLSEWRSPVALTNGYIVKPAVADSVPPLMAIEEDAPFSFPCQCPSSMVASATSPTLAVADAWITN
jgi:hypothetical protein